MKRFHKAMFVFSALLCVVIAGGVWLINSALNVASDVVDTTLGGAQKVQAIAQREVVSVARSAQDSTKFALTGTEHALGTPDEPALTSKAPKTSPADEAPVQIADTGTNSASKVPAEANQEPKQTDGADSLGDFGGLLKLFLSDGDDASALTSVLTPDEKSEDTNTKEDKADGKNADDALTDMIPGANSPTLKRWMAGKYKGHEEQAVDDAFEDPKIWRLIFFLSGGM